MSRQELVRRRRGSSFQGRERELAVFRENLGRDPLEDGFRFLFHVHGLAGVGKTSLVRQWEALAQRQGLVTAMVGDEVHSVLEAMEAVGAQLARQGHALKGFERLLAAYRQRRHEADAATAVQADAAAAAGPGQGAPPSAAGTLAAQAALVGLGLVPGVGAVAGALMDPQAVAAAADRARAAVGSRLRSHEDAALVLNPLGALTPKWLAELDQVAQRCAGVVLFFDTFERTGPVLEGWLRDVLFTEAYGGLAVNVQVVLSGQGRLSSGVWGDWLDQVTPVPLAVFSEEEARALLASRGVGEERVVEVVLRLSGRLPVLLDTLAQTRPRDAGEVGDPSGTAIERFLKWVQGAGRREAALACALPLRLDEEVYRAVAPAEAAGEYAWLRGLPFVTEQGGACRYHEVIRATMVRHQRTHFPARWREHHALLAGTHGRRRRAAEEARPCDAPWEDHWEDGEWREHRLQEVYHLLCARPRQALPEALHDLVRACDTDETLRRWTEMLTQAAADTASEPLVRLAERLAKAGADTDLLQALTVLLAAPGLDRADQALARALRGREHRHAGEYGKALADYDAALAIDPALARAYAGRGETHRVAHHYDEAVRDFTRALELDPADTWAVIGRGEAHHDTARYEEALADFTRAVELDPANAYAVAGRGWTHVLMDRHEEALADFTRAVELAPDYPYAVASRGWTHVLMDRHEEAVADSTRAIELSPDYAFPFATRGRGHRALDRHDEALADFTRAVELHPEYTYAIAQRGETHRLAGRHEEALADFAHALGIDPDHAFSLASRGVVHRVAGRYDEALADLDRAVALDPGYTFAIAQRGEVHLRTRRYGEALADFTRALELGPAADWILAQRGNAHRLTGRYEEAAADLTRAIALDPDYTSAIADRGTAYLLAGRCDEAVADFTRAAGLDADLDWAFAGRGAAHRLAGRHGDARADLERAVALDPDAVEYRCLYAVILHTTGAPEEASAQWQRAVDLCTARASGDGPDAVEAQGELIMVLCGMGDWSRAAEQADAFLAASPGREQILEALETLAESVPILSLPQDRIDPLLRRLHEALPPPGP